VFLHFLRQFAAAGGSQLVLVVGHSFLVKPAYFVGLRP